MWSIEFGLVLLFWSSVALVLATYLGYPLAIAAAARIWGGRRPPPPIPPAAELPVVSLLIAARDEEDVIAGRLRNALELDYPRDRIEVLVGADGCTDSTAAVAREFVASGVRVFEFAENRGKPSVINDLAAAARGEILLMTDANTRFDPAVARRLTRWFADPAVGVACGRLVLVDRPDGRNADGRYWKYETFLKRCEAQLGVALGANGAIYAIRRRLFRPIPADTLIDDFTIPLRARLAEGCRCVFDEEALAIEETAPDLAGEFRRRARIGAGDYQAVGRLPGLLNPRQGWYAPAFLGHKVLRWLCPFFLIVALGTNIALAGRPPYGFLLVAQLLGYSTPAIPEGARRRSPLPIRLAALFVGMNAALLAGFWRWLGGNQSVRWRRTDRLEGADRLRPVSQPACPVPAVPPAVALRGVP